VIDVATQPAAVTSAPPAPEPAPPLLLDTHVWVWLALGTPGSLDPQVLAAIDAAARRRALLLSITSVWEVAMLHAKQRLHLPMPVATWVERALAPADITLLPLARPPVLLDSCALPGDFHADPADRLLVATARAEGATLVTRDRKILDYAQLGHVRVMAA
jgi:PIN domain nuclease of toxin-antitoxin system